MIIRKIVESQNPEMTSSAAEWQPEDWEKYRHQIHERQDVLNDLNVVTLICSIISQTTKLSVLEESLLVAVAVLLGGNVKS